MSAQPDKIVSSNTRENDTNKKQHFKKRMQTTRFRGRCDELKDHVFEETMSMNTDMFSDSKRELAMHIGANYKHGSDTRFIIENMTEFVMPRPTRPAAVAPLRANATADETAEHAAATEECEFLRDVCREGVKTYSKRQEILVSKMKRAYTLLWGQCSDIIQSKVTGLARCGNVDRDQDLTELLRATREVMYQGGGKKSPYVAVCETKKTQMVFRQMPNVANDTCLRKFKTLIEVVESLGGNIANDPGLARLELEAVGLDIDTATPDEVTLARERVKNKSIAMQFVMSSDRVRHGKMVEELNNDYLFGADHWPNDLNEGHEMLVNYECDERNNRTSPIDNNTLFVTRVGEDEEQQFDNTTVFVAKTGKKILEDPGNAVAMITSTGKYMPKCFNCNKHGYLSKDCPDKKEPGEKKGSDAEKKKKDGKENVVAIHVDESHADLDLEFDFQFVSHVEASDSTDTEDSGVEDVTQLCTVHTENSLTEIPVIIEVGSECESDEDPHIAHSSSEDENTHNDTQQHAVDRLTRPISDITWERVVRMELNNIRNVEWRCDRGEMRFTVMRDISLCFDSTTTPQRVENIDTTERFYVNVDDEQCEHDNATLCEDINNDNTQDKRLKARSTCLVSNGGPSTKAKINKWWLLLDSQATKHVFCNHKLAKNLRRSKRGIRVHGHGGSRDTDIIGDVSGLKDPVWIDQGGIANVLSLKQVREQHHVTYVNDDQGASFIVHKLKGNDIVFTEHPSSLCFHDAKRRIEEHEEILVTTVKEKLELHTEREVARSAEARKTCVAVGRPSPSNFLNLIRGNLLLNCPVTVDDVKIAQDIWGTELGSLKGKTARTTPDVVNANLVPIPKHIAQRFRVLTLSADIMFVNKIPFLVSLSRRLKFQTVQALKSRTVDNLVKSIKKIVNTYSIPGFKIKCTYMDREFEAMRDPLLQGTNPIVINTAGADDHVPDIERRIRVVKERVRATKAMLPFKKTPKAMIIESVFNATLWLNSFPSKNSLSKTMSPRSIVTGILID